MATIAFVVTPVAGHLNPSFKLAKALKLRGHRVCYLGISDSGEHLYCRPEVYLHAQEMEYLVVLNETLPDTKAILNTENFMRRLQQAISANKEIIKEHVDKVRPDIFIVDKLLLPVALLAHEFGIPAIILNSMLPVEDLMGISRSILGSEAIALLLKMPELILCPQELDFPQAKAVPGRHYIEASVDISRKEDGFPWEKLDRRKPLIYCSLGTHSYMFEGHKRLFQISIDALKMKPDWQMVIMLGAHLKADDFHSIPPNVLVANRVPQIELLKRVSIMVNHGGLGSIKECILFGVPMIIFPYINDQPLNAARVAYHGLGLIDDRCRVTPVRMCSLIDRISQDRGFKQRVESMRRKFTEIERAGIGVEKVENFLQTGGLSC